jgi:arginyl-tRNA synthetase
LDADPQGERVFVPAMKQFVPRLEEVEPAYKFVNAVEDAPESEQFVLTRHTAAGPRQVRLSRVSNDVIAMLQAGGPENEQEEKVWEKVRQASLDEAQKIYQRLDVSLRPEDVRGESSYRDRLAETVEELRRSVHAREPSLERVGRIAVEDSQGAVVVFQFSPEGQPLFLNKEGEPLPFLIRKSDGAYLYSTTDLAALRFRVHDLQADRLIYVTDARQALHFEMLFATVRGAGWTRAADGHDIVLAHVTFGSITGEDGKPIKTREGGSVKLVSLLDEAAARATSIVRSKRPDFSEQHVASVANAVGIGAVKYADLSKDRVSDYVFSWEKMLALDGNTAPYLQYAHARIQSIFRKAGGKADRSARIILESPCELAIAKHILRLGEVLAVAARDLKPHHLCTYLYDLSTKFSSFYDECPVIQSEEPTRSSRLLLCELTARTLEIGLDLLGIEHPDEM